MLRIREHGDKAKSIWTHLDDSASECWSLLGRRFPPTWQPRFGGAFSDACPFEIKSLTEQAPVSQSNCRLLIVGGRHLLRIIFVLMQLNLALAKNALLRRAIQGYGLLVTVLEIHARPYTAQPWGWLPSYGASSRILRSTDVYETIRSSGRSPVRPRLAEMSRPADSPFPSSGERAPFHLSDHSITSSARGEQRWSL